MSNNIEKGPSIGAEKRYKEIEEIKEEWEKKVSERTEEEKIEKYREYFRELELGPLRDLVKEVEREAESRGEKLSPDMEIGKQILEEREKEELENLEKK